MTDLFLSYAPQDKFLARRIAALFLERGYSASFEHADVGVARRSVARRPIGQAHIVLLLASSHARDCWRVHREVELAREFERPLLALCLEEGGGAEVDRTWRGLIDRSLHLALDAPDFMDRLVDIVGRCIEHAESGQRRWTPAFVNPQKQLFDEAHAFAALPIKRPWARRPCDVRRSLAHVVGTYHPMRGSLALFDRMLEDAERDHASATIPRLRKARAARKPRSDRPKHAAIVSSESTARCEESDPQCSFSSLLAARGRSSLVAQQVRLSTALWNRLIVRPSVHREETRGLLRVLVNECARLTSDAAARRLQGTRSSSLSLRDLVSNAFAGFCVCRIELLTDLKGVSTSPLKQEGWQGGRSDCDGGEREGVCEALLEFAQARAHTPCLVAGAWRCCDGIRSSGGSISAIGHGGIRLAKTGRGGSAGFDQDDRAGPSLDAMRRTVGPDSSG